MGVWAALLRPWCCLSVRMPRQGGILWWPVLRLLQGSVNSEPIWWLLGLGSELALLVVLVLLGGVGLREVHVRGRGGRGRWFRRRWWQARLMMRF